MSGDTTLQLADGTTGFASANGIVSIEDEIITYTARSGNNLTGCVRGSFGTTAIGHALGATVRARLVSGFITEIQTAITAIETMLGISGSNFALASSIFKWKGVWSSSTTYTTYDVVSYGGSSFISKINPNLNHTPADGVYWGILAQGGASATTTAYTITAATEISSPNTPEDGEFLTVIITQDATGYAVAWDSSFKIPPVIPTDPNMTSVCQFVGKSSYWWLSAVPVLGAKA